MIIKDCSSKQLPCIGPLKGWQGAIQGPSTSAHTFCFSEITKIQGQVRCGALSVEVPEHGQEQLTWTLIVDLLKARRFWSSESCKDPGSLIPSFQPQCNTQYAYSSIISWIRSWRGTRVPLGQSALLRLSFSSVWYLSLKSVYEIINALFPLDLTPKKTTLFLLS